MFGRATYRLYLLLTFRGWGYARDAAPFWRAGPGPWRWAGRRLCRRGRHEWLYYDGRPANCAFCGAVGHPLAYRAVGDLIRDALRGEG